MKRCSRIAIEKITGRGNARDTRLNSFSGPAVRVAEPARGDPKRVKSDPKRVVAGEDVAATANGSIAIFGQIPALGFQVDIINLILDRLRPAIAAVPSSIAKPSKI